MPILPRSTWQRAASAGVAAAFSLSSLSQTVSTRETKKLATEAIPLKSPPAFLRSSRPER
jgi:hypothetical protein